MTVSSIYRYPVKGLSAEPLTKVTLTAGECLPHDRRFAIAHASTQVNPKQPEWLPKTHFFMLMRDEKMAQLQTRFDEHTGFFTIERAGELLFNSRITDAVGRKSFEAFFITFLMGHPGGPPKLVEVPGHTFADAQQKPDSTTYKYVSLVNLSSVRALEQVAMAPVDPVRFRANIYFEGVAAWDELNWMGNDLRLGGARLRVVAPITRCPATAVNPATAERDLDVPAILVANFAHRYMGVYAQVEENGMVEPNDRLMRI
ncbi:MAG: MOSC domain-containing protein [Betaproteobacteria bacterium]